MEENKNQELDESLAVPAAKEPEWKQVSREQRKSTKAGNSAGALALLIILLVGIIFMLVANAGVITDYFELGNASPISAESIYTGTQTAANTTDLWARAIAISIIVTAVSVTIAMFAVLNIASNLSNLSETLEDIRSDVKR